MAKRVAIMQPYFLPYIGYFQLINSVDEFIIYDNIQYTKKGWINRNRILVNGKDQLITIPLKKDSDYLDVVQRELSESWERDRIKMLNTIKSAYGKAPYYTDAIELIFKCLNQEEGNLFKFIYNSIVTLNDYLEIKTPIVVSSTIDIDHTLTSQDKVIALCKNQNTDVYINTIGGVELYDKVVFKQSDIELKFIKTNAINYRQFRGDFVPWLSILDIIMFNSKQTINDFLKNYTLL